jgi:putative oxidoreductase
MSTVTRVFAFAQKTLALAEHLQPVALLVARVVVGLVFVFSGWGKLHGLEQVIEYFRTLGIPAPELQAPFVAAVEFVGGLAVVAGLGTRLAAVPLSATMVVAIATAKWKEVAGVSDVVGFSETDYLVFFLVLIAFGAGRFSLDALVGPRLRSLASGTSTLPTTAALSAT